MIAARTRMAALPAMSTAARARLPRKRHESTPIRRGITQSQAMSGSSMGLSPEVVEVIDVHDVHRRPDPKEEDRHNEHPERYIEDDTDLDEERHTVAHRHARKEDAVLARIEPDHLRDRLLAGDHDEDSDEGERDPIGERVPRHRLLESGKRFSHVES